MSAAAVLDECRAAGVMVWADGERLRFKSAAPLPDGLLDELRAHKPGLIALLVGGGEAASSFQKVPGLPPSSVTCQIDRDFLALWLRNECLCLVYRDGCLAWTGRNGQGLGDPSTALHEYVAQHTAAIIAMMSPVEV